MKSGHPGYGHRCGLSSFFKIWASCLQSTAFTWSANIHLFQRLSFGGRGKVEFKMFGKWTCCRWTCSTHFFFSIPLAPSKSSGVSGTHGFDLASLLAADAEHELGRWKNNSVDCLFFIDAALMIPARCDWGFSVRLTTLWPWK